MILLDVVREQGIVNDFDELRKTLPEDPAHAPEALASRVLGVYEAKRRLHLFVRGLFQRCYRDDLLASLLVPFLASESNDDAAKEASIALRANTLQQRALRDFLNEIEGKLCVIAAVDSFTDDVRRGTGVLVAPDLVLTAYHTLKTHIANGNILTPQPGPLYAFFDHYDGPPIVDPSDKEIRALRVSFHKDWLVCCCEDMEMDGQFLKPDVEQTQMLKNRLDFALVRLAEPVGRHTRRSSGGLRRSWLNLTNSTSVLRKDDRIIIPQHPHGYPQRIDFGRYSDIDSGYDTSNTRIRYNTETDKGTSGAPCFNQEFKFVGLHNAAFEPQGINIRKNQAIRSDRLLDRLNGKIPLSVPAPAVSRIWSVTASGAAPRVILGRNILLDWIDRAENSSLGDRIDRIYAAVASDKRAGRSFSTEILLAARRDSGDPTVALGNGDQIPNSVSDFIRAIGYQLRIPQQQLNLIPPRPGADLPAGSADGDKLRKWASEDVPRWFDGILSEHRKQVVDRRIEAKKAIDALKVAGIIDIPSEYATLVNSAEPVYDTRYRWPIAWIVLDNVTSTSWSGELRDLLAGLIGGNLPEDAVPSELRRLRWLFLGGIPDFLSPSQVTIEILNPSEIGVDAMAAATGYLAESLDQPIDDAAREVLVKAMIGAWMGDPEVGARINDPLMRLDELQGYFGRMIGNLEKFLRASP